MCRHVSATSSPSQTATAGRPSLATEEERDLNGGAALAVRRKLPGSRLPLDTHRDERIGSARRSRDDIAVRADDQVQRHLRRIGLVSSFFPARLLQGDAMRSHDALHLFGGQRSWRGYGRRGSGGGRCDGLCRRRGNWVVAPVFQDETTRLEEEHASDHARDDEHRSFLAAAIRSNQLG